MTFLTLLADRLCSHSDSPSLRPFTDGDWMAYAGCESDSPEIGDGEGIEVILDGNRVNVSLYPAGRKNGVWDVFFEVFATEGEARAVCLLLLGNQGLVPKILGESVGTC